MGAQRKVSFQDRVWFAGFGRVEVGVACKIREDGASRNSEAGSLNCCALLFTSAHWQRKGVLSH